jgi:acetyl esterase/lipase
MRRKTFLTGALAALAGACTPSLATFNRLTPHDGGATRIASGEAFGRGPRQKLDVYAPKSRGGDLPAPNLPVIVFLYGGSWNSGDRRDYEFVGDAFAAHGFVTVIPDYRVAPDVFPSFVEDAAKAVQWTRDHAPGLGADPSRIVLVGHSAGAYNAMMIALDAHYLRDVGVDGRIIAGVAGLAGPYDFYPFDVASTRAAFGTFPDPEATQPIHFVRADEPPVFLAWGSEDKLVGRRNIVNLAAAIHAAGARVETKIYPHVAHVGLMLALSPLLRSRASVLADVVGFARRVAA